MTYRDRLLVVRSLGEARCNRRDRKQDEVRERGLPDRPVVLVNFSWTFVGGRTRFHPAADPESRRRTAVARPGTPDEKERVVAKGNNSQKNDKKNKKAKKDDKKKEIKPLERIEKK